MKLIGNLKKKGEKTNSRTGAKAVIREAGMLLNDDELDEVSGGLFGLFEGKLQTGQLEDAPQPCGLTPPDPAQVGITGATQAGIPPLSPAPSVSTDYYDQQRAKYQ